MGRGKYHAKTSSRKENVSILFAPQRLCASKLYSYPKLRHYQPILRTSSGLIIVTCIILGRSAHLKVFLVFPRTLLYLIRNSGELAERLLHPPVEDGRKAIS